uniref:Nuclear factor related to kappa-B-binding protein n=1 Tax=Oryzias sinensis TaxID=183150 RepID=A0A8C7YH02_9TELE
MDSLSQMITGRLDPKEGNDGVITEECMLGNCRVSLPEDLLEDPDIFFSVLSQNTWNEVLTDSQRQHLRHFLPQFPDNNPEEQDSTIADLFNNRNFHFGNPLHLAQKLFRDGYFNPEVVKYRQLCAKSQKKRHLHALQQYYHKLLKQILVSRKELLDFAVQNGLDFPPKRRLPNKTQAEMRETRVRRRWSHILKEVKTECGDTFVFLPSSPAEMALWTQTPQSPSSPSSTVSLRVLPTLSTQDMKTSEKVELSELDLKVMLQNHCEKRKRQPDHPDLITSDIQLRDILSRSNIGRKGTMPLFDLSLPKKKRDERRRKKLRTIKTETEDPCESLPLSEALSAPPAHISGPLPEAPCTPQAIIKEEVVEDCQSSPGAVEEITASFFSLLESIFRTEGLASTLMLEEKVQMWQMCPASSFNPWFSFASCWSDLVLQALQFLAGETKDGMMALPSGFSPFVEFVDECQQWRWIGATQDTEKDLGALCQLWLDSKDFVVKTESEDISEMMSPIPKLSTDYVVRPSTGDERQVFQEQQRYNEPHKAFTFRMHGFESVVGPVKGVFDKEMSLNKAREHTLLRSDRPPYVTILSLVRDAAARLPNGEGTRAEICELLKDSQFLAPDVTSAQVNTVVSGALDRLHYEKDPCVKYDIGRKLWIYLHRHRSQEEFERIHQAQAAAAKARKALQQKPKPASKPKSGSKDGGGKTPGSVEPGQDVSSNPMSPISATLTPNTPGTPKSPLPFTASTPTKTGVPDAVKTSPGSAVLLVSPPSLPQLGTVLPTSQACPPASQPVSSQHTARIVSHLAASSLPQVRVVSAQPALAPSAASQQTTLVHQTPHQIRVPVSVAAKGISQAVVSVPLRSQSGTSPVQVPTTLSMSAVTVPKPQTGSPGSPANKPASPAVLQGVTSSNIKQVSITGQLGMKTPGSAGIPITATNLRIQGKDVLRLPPSSITTDAKGQTVLRITPDMMATLAKSPVATVKLTSDFLGSASAGSKSISATLHVTPPHLSPSSASSAPPCMGETQTTKAGPISSTVLKAAGDTAIRLMPTLAVNVADQKSRTFSSDKSATIRIMPGLGVIPQKQGQTITMTTSTGNKPLPVPTCANVVTMAASVATVTKSITVAPGVSAAPLTLATATAAVRQVPGAVVTTQAGKLPARITVPLSVLNQPLKTKSVVTTPIVKGSINTNISTLGRNIILTTMPAGTKLIAGNKPVSFVTAQQFQQLQQQGQATQVRIQTIPTQQLQQHIATGSPKSLSTVVVTTAPSHKPAPDPPPAPQN